DAVVAAMVRRSSDGLHLAYPKVWEAHMYMTAPFPGAAVATVAKPILVLRGEPSIYFDRQRARWLQRSQPSISFRDMDGVGHLLPFEAPKQAGENILTWLEEAVSI
ncbi:MAG: alpha/beta hydrolase, partial [Myxococcota bacterium]